jgi:hypothetical protein
MGGSGLPLVRSSHKTGIGDHPDSAGRDVEMSLVGSLTDSEALHFARFGIHSQYVVCRAGWIRVAAPDHAATSADPLA